MQIGDKLKVVAHSGNFHADDIFAVATLSLLLEKEGKEYEVIRTRDEKIIETGDYVVDVGGVYNELKNRFDHHQEGRAGERENGIPYASFGLVWKKFGEELCGNREVADKIDIVLVQYIDATDNGVSVVETKFKDVYPYDIGLFFNSYTPSWKEKVDIDKVFAHLVDIAREVLNREIIKRNNIIEARSIVQKIYADSEDKRLIVMDSYYPSYDALSRYPEPLLIVYPRDDGKWGLSSLKIDPNKFEYRMYFPESWGGKRDSEFEEISGVSGAVFCHTGRHLAVAKSKEAVLKLAEISLKS